MGIEPIIRKTDTLSACPFTLSERADGQGGVYIIYPLSGPGVRLSRCRQVEGMANRRERR